MESFILFLLCWKNFFLFSQFAELEVCILFIDEKQVRWVEAGAEKDFSYCREKLLAQWFRPTSRRTKFSEWNGYLSSFHDISAYVRSSRTPSPFWMNLYLCTMLKSEWTPLISIYTELTKHIFSFFFHFFHSGEWDK